MPINEAPWTTTHGWIYDVDGELVGICWGKTPEEAERNAQLASVAPEMLEALEEVKSELDTYVPTCPLCGGSAASGHKYNCLWHVVNAAIKKARGEE